MDLERYFDTVNHSRLIQILSETIKDGRVISLIHKFLNAGVMSGGVFERSEEGVPQGGPLSPILGNIMLNECDKELERRGHRFVRYADDLMIFCKSRKAAERTLKNIAPFIEEKLFLRINREKTKVANVAKVKFLGYGFYIYRGQGRLRVHPQSIQKLKDKIRQITGRSNGMGIQRRKERLLQIVRGWVNYFKLADMKNILKHAVVCLVLAAAVASCTKETTPERINIQHPDQQSPILRDNAYYQALREYKKTKHKIAFGWYGSWTAVGASYQTRLQSAPDSMDIISIWSQWHSLTPEQIADKEFVQKIKGTKVTFTIFSDKMPEPFLTEIGGGEYTDEAIEAYAKAYCKDSMDKYSYDGIDVDYEPGYGASGPFVGHDNELFRKLILAMSKYVGPKSGTGRLLMIDGVPYAVHADVADCFDYGIVQAYNSYGYTDLQDRFDDAYKKGWKPEQYIFAENFESLWKTGGVSHECRDGQWVNSLLGMARFNPTQGFGAGFGAYHMEYEYANSSMPYKYMREAIQDVNPAGGDLIVGLTSTGLSKYLFLVGDDGTITGEVDEKIRVELARPAPADVSFPLAIDNSLVDAYNEKHGTSYEPIDPARVSLGTLGVAAGAFLSDEVSVTVSSAGIEKGYYLIPIVVELPAEDIYTSKEPLVRYLLLTVSAMEIDVDATALTGVKIEPASGWTIVCYQGTASSGANGVWNLDSDAQKACMFDGKLDSNCWYAANASYSWGNGGNFIITLDKAYDINGFRWHIYYEDSNPECTDFQYSEDYL